MTSPLRDDPILTDDATRRQVLIGAGALAALLAGCGTESNPAPSVGGGAAGFPVTIEHRYGSTTIPREPQRVVTVGYLDQDPVVALG
ncbi:MAG: iron-siderophore ABC transporter substrate-binding protein, partial [Pseudonocardiaceae bacterium]